MLLLFTVHRRRNDFRLIIATGPVALGGIIIRPQNDLQIEDKIRKDVHLGSQGPEESFSKEGGFAVVLRHGIKVTNLGEGCYEGTVWFGCLPQLIVLPPHKESVMVQHEGMTKGFNKS